MTKQKTFTPKPIIMEALPSGAQNAQQAAHMRQEQSNQEQVGLMKVGGGTPCPQSPMFGMLSTPNDGNAISCSMNGTHAQGHANSAYDSMVGKVASGGRRKRKSQTRSKKRSKSHNLKKSTRHTKKRSKSHNLKKRTRHSKKSRKHRK